MWLLRKLTSAIGIGTRAFFTLVGIAGITYAVADYQVNLGSGPNFGSVVQTSVHYAKQIVCDFTAPATICATVKAANTVATTDVGLVVAVANTLPPGQAALASSSPVAIAKNSGTGSTVAGAAIGTAGTPSAEIVTVQGLSNGTPVPVTASPLTLGGGAPLVKGTTAAMTGTTSTQIIAAVTSNRIYATRVSCKGDPANAVATKVLIQDGSGGTTLDTLSVAASGGGEQATGPTPLFWTTSGNGLFAANVTNGASVICTGSGYSGG